MRQNTQWMMQQRPTRASRPENGSAVVRPLPFSGDDRALVAGLKDGHAGAATALYDRYADHVQRVLARILGVDSDLEDLLHEVFVQALGSAASIEDGDRLKGWITIVAVHTARAHIRRRVRRRWLQFWEPAFVPDVPIAGDDHEARELVRLTYGVLDKLPAKERIAFALRHFDGMELAELADVNGVSLATVKRLLARAERRFASLAQCHPPLAARLEGHARWRSP
jgi:RNA polymerase sigma-70 factor (ECF subfamily)